MPPPLSVSETAIDRMRIIRGELGDETFVQPHPLFFSWALEADIDTDHIDVTLGILKGENLSPPPRSGQSKDNYIFMLNDFVETHMQRWNAIWDMWPDTYKHPSVAREMVHTKSFMLDPMRERMRALVASRGSDQRFTPTTLRFDMSPKLFFLLFGGFAAVTTLTATRIDVPFPHASDLDFLFTPTLADLAVDGGVHPYFGHLLCSRWYYQTFDATNAVDVDATGAHIPRALDWEVTGAVTMHFFRASNTLTVSCSWIGKHKTANARDLTKWNVGKFAQ